MGKRERKKKYEFSGIERLYRFHTLHRIRALVDIPKYHVKAGDLGGWIESEKNLDHSFNCWVGEEALVYGDAEVWSDAIVHGYAIVFGKAQVFDRANVFNNACIYGDAEIFGDALVYGNATVNGYAKVYANANVYEDAVVCDSAMVYGNAQVMGNSTVAGEAKISDQARISDFAIIKNNAEVYDNASISGFAQITQYAVVCDNAEVANTLVSSNASICGDAVLKSNTDYIVFRNTWSSGRHFTYTKSNKMWKVGCFYGTGEELVKKAYKDSKLSGKCYEMYVNLVKQLEAAENDDDNDSDNR